MNDIIRVQASALASVIPSMLGYRPTRSLVCLALDENGRSKFVARVDLPAATGEVDAWQLSLAEVAVAGERQAVRTFVPVLWDEGDEVRPALAAGVLDAAREALNIEADTPALVVRAHTTRVHSADAVTEHPRGDVPAGDQMRLARHETTGGMVEFDSRDAVSATLRAGEPLPGWPPRTSARLRSAYDIPTAARVWVTTLRSEHPSGQEVASLVVSLKHYPALRDAIVSTWAGGPALEGGELLPEHPDSMELLRAEAPQSNEDRAAAWHRLARIIRGVPTGHSADLCAIAAVLGARLGQDCLATAACERALQDNPRHRLSLLLSTAQRTGLLAALITSP